MVHFLLCQTNGQETFQTDALERTGFLDYIERGDHGMADRGFLINDLLLQRGAYLNMPPFTRACNHGKGRYLTSYEIKQ